MQRQSAPGYCVRGSGRGCGMTSAGGAYRAAQRSPARTTRCRAGHWLGSLSSCVAHVRQICGRSVPSQCDPYSLYVQLSRCPLLDGIVLLSEARERDIVGNVVPPEMIEVEKHLGELNDITIRQAESWDW